MSLHKSTMWLLAVAITIFISLPAIAVPVTVNFDDAISCDPLEDGTNIHELGIGTSSGGATLFPPNEEIFAGAMPTNLVACSSSDDPTLGNVEVRMQNLSGIDWNKVWYVADEETTISNVDGTVNGGRAFLINSTGINTPLVFESMALDGIFEAGEFWSFVIDDYSSAFGGSAADFLSVGLVGFPSTGDPLKSTGSIIATADPIPEPASLMLALLGVSAAFVTRRRR